MFVIMHIIHIGAVIKSKKDTFPLTAGHLGNIAEDYFVLIVNNYRMIVSIASISASHSSLWVAAVAQFVSVQAAPKGDYPSLSEKWIDKRELFSQKVRLEIRTIRISLVGRGA